MSKICLLPFLLNVMILTCMISWRTTYSVVQSASAEVFGMRDSHTDVRDRVACWPSARGVWIKHAELVDLDFLGLSGWGHEPRQLPINQTEEDALCKRLQLVGAQWWGLPTACEQRDHLGKDQFACVTLKTSIEPDVKKDYLIAWTENERVACYVPIAEAEQQGEERMNMFYNAPTMEDRCHAIRGLGGEWCRCSDECPVLKDLIYGFAGRDGDGCIDDPWDDEY